MAAGEIITVLETTDTNGEFDIPATGPWLGHCSDHAGTVKVQVQVGSDWVDWGSAWSGNEAIIIPLAIEHHYRINASAAGPQVTLVNFFQGAAGSNPDPS